MSGTRFISLIGLAVLFTLLNTLRPLHIDDTAYYYYATQMARNPLDPYGFEIFWNKQPQPASEVLAPPVLPYYWAAAIRLFGERPFLWKIWLLPVALIFVFSLHALCRRFACGFELPLVWLIVFSPAFLPSFNLMLDVPGLALSLCALTIFLRACDRHAVGLAVAAGIVAGVAAQTKYNALLMPAVMVVYALLTRRLRLGAIAAVVAYSCFAAWEAVMMYRYGHSHFLYHLHSHGELLKQNTSSLLSLLMILGGVAPAIMLLGMAALRVRPLLIALAGVGVLLEFALLPCIDRDFPARLGIPFRLNPGSVVFGFLGCLACGTLILCARRLCSNREMSPRVDRDAWFLVLWLGLEVAGYFMLSPFPAVRRVLGVTVVGALLVGRLLSRDCPTGTWCVRSIVTSGVVLALGYYAVDLQDALAQQSTAEESALWVRRQGHGKGWYVGHWGFQFYAESAGLQPVIPGVTRLQRDDWLVVPCARVEQQKIQIPAEWLNLSVKFYADDVIPFCTTSCYYGSRSPLEPLHGPRLSATVYRVLHDVTPGKRAGER